jgi:hypothetical protein
VKLLLCYLNLLHLASSLLYPYNSIIKCNLALLFKVLQSCLRSDHRFENCHTPNNYQLWFVLGGTQIFRRSVQSEYFYLKKIKNKKINRQKTIQLYCSFILGLRKRNCFVQVAQCLRHLEHLSDKIFSQVWRSKVGKSKGFVRAVFGILPCKVC